MIQLNKLPKITTRKKKIIGRGFGSGKGGHTVGRGSKGAKARGKIPLAFEGTKIKKSWLKRLPLWRGKGRFKSFKNAPVIVNLKYLNVLPKNSKVNLGVLVKCGIVNEKEIKNFGVKILGGGELKIPLQVELPCSKSAVEKIKKAGGSVVLKKRADK